VQEVPLAYPDTAADKERGTGTLRKQGFLFQLYVWVCGNQDNNNDPGHGRFATLSGRLANQDISN
jgi:hypothetical protein